LNRRLLILCYFFPPLAGGGVHRVLGFTRHLPEAGWDCTVVCAGPDDYWVVDPSLVARVHPGTEVVRVSGGSALAAWLRLRRGERGRRPGRWFGPLRALSDWWLLPDSYIGWSRRAGRAGEEVARRGRFDAVLSSSPPDSVHVAALRVAGRTGLPWVVDFRDPWIGLSFRRPPTAWHLARQRAIERSVLEGSRLVLAASETHAARLRAALGPAAGRVEHLPNGYEPAALGGDGDAPADGTHFTMVFTGVLSLMPDVEVFLDAVHDVLARRPEARRRLRARLAGPFDQTYADRAVALGLTGIVDFAGPLAHAEARALQRRADLLLAWQPRGFPTMVPGKLYEYFEAARPVLAIVEEGTESAALVARAGGTVVPTGDRAALAREIERHYAAWREGSPFRQARPGWLDGHRRSALAGRLAGLLDRVAGSAA
jgi:glycosyltransferase involved in cell wall biosynthesis